MARWIPFAAGAFLVAYFVYFAKDGLRGHFALDDLANIFYYHHRGNWSVLQALIEFPSTYLRPMGALFYLPIFHFAGFNPLPFRIAALIIIAINVVVFYSFARLLTGSRKIAWLAALLVSYHPYLSDILYSNAVIYDVLCFGFYFAALGWYLRARSREHLLGWKETAVFLLLYICALNSKEMAVTMPVTILLYELLYHSPVAFRPSALVSWLKSEGRMMIIAGLVTAAFVAGKTMGADPLIAISAYKPEFTFHRASQSITENIQSMFYIPDRFATVTNVSIGVAVLLAYAWNRKSRLVAFCVLFAILSALPIAFLVRAWACLYIPLGAWSLLIAAAVWGAADLISRYVAPNPSRAATAAILVVAAVLSYAAFETREKAWIQPALLKQQDKTWAAIREFGKLQTKPRRGAWIAFLNDPFDDWDMEFLAELTYRDRTLQQTLVRKTPLTAKQLADVDYIFDYRDGKFIQVKP
jgi:hypothetical protein